MTPGPWHVGYVPTKKREVYVANEKGENVIGAGQVSEADAKAIVAMQAALTDLLTNFAGPELCWKYEEHVGIQDVCRPETVQTIRDFLQKGN